MFEFAVIDSLGASQIFYTAAWGLRTPRIWTSRLQSIH